MKQIITAVTLQLFLLINCSPTEPNGDNGNGIDTTSQNFTFETYEFGDGFNSSYFRDVWVFDENNIWAVGEVSLEEGFTNIMRWNGEKWYAQKPWFTSSGFSGIWAMDSSNIYFATGNIIHYKNGDYEHIIVPGNWSTGQAVHKLWGSSESNIWGVGPWGTIVHYDGVEWTKIDFDTQWYFYGITGNKATGIAYAVARKSDFETIIVQLNKENMPTIIFSSNTAQYPTQAFAINMIDNETICIAGKRVVFYNIKTREEKAMLNFTTSYFIETLGSFGKNDIYMFGSTINEGQKMTHFNGSRFTTYDFAEKDFMIFGGISAIKDLAVMASFSDDKAYLIIIRRTK